MPRPFVLCVGEIKQRKGHATSVPAFLAAWRQAPELHFAIVGRFVDIAPVVERLAAEFGMTAVMITDYPSNSSGDDYWLSSTDQILVTRNPAILQHERIAAVAEPIKRRPGFPVWTDDFNNLMTVLK